MTSRELIETALLAALVIAALAILAASFPLSDPAPTPVPTDTPTPGDSSRSDAGRPGNTEWLTSIDSSILGLLGVVLLVAVFVVYRLLYRSRGAADTGPDLPASEPSPDRGKLDRVAETAGNAADRISDGSSITLENEVYHAWWEMTRALTTPNRGSKTPRDFEALAIRAGMDGEDVRELTRLFEEIRYGDRQSTTDDERRAIDLLRRIESTYGTDQS